VAYKIIGRGTQKREPVTQMGPNALPPPSPNQIIVRHDTAMALQLCPGLQSKEKLLVILAEQQYYVASGGYIRQMRLR
jgi:hypothetical protein